VRNAVRQYLSASEYAREFRSGENFEGGDGVTMVELN
jgi:DNA mismatch repair protein MutS2